MQVNLKRSLGWVEAGFYLGGIALLAVFFVLRFDADRQREAGIAGHRDSFFRGLKDVAIGDRIDLLTGQDNLAYTVSSIDIVDPGDVWVLAPSDLATITLVTCYPFYYVGHAPKRFIVKATAEHSLAN